MSADGGLPPSLQTWLARGNGTAGLVFADILGSVLLVHGQGTAAYAQILSTYRNRADRLAAEFDGRVISKEGDELFVAFLTAANAYRFAAQMFSDAGHPLVTVRVGVHVGVVTCHESGLVGRTVPLAHRVMDRAATHEFWMSDIAKRTLESESAELATGIRWLAEERCVLEGIPEPQLLWRAS